MYERTMKEYKNLIYIFMIFFLFSGCKTADKKLNENKDSIEIIVSCGEDNNLEEYINDGWNIKQEYSEEKFVHGKQLLPQKIAIWKR